jgi:hypothetical protein
MANPNLVTFRLRDGPWDSPPQAGRAKPEDYVWSGARRRETPQRVAPPQCARHGQNLMG